MITEDLLDEYVKVTITVENIQKKINKHKKTIETRLEKATNDNEKNACIEEYKLFIMSIKNDPEIVNKYKMLKNKQANLRGKILSNNNIKLKDNLVNSSISMSEIKDDLVGVTETTDSNNTSNPSNPSKDNDEISDDENNKNNGIDETLNNLRLKYV